MILQSVLLFVGFFATGYRTFEGFLTWWGIRSTRRRDLNALAERVKSGRESGERIGSESGDRSSSLHRIFESCVSEGSDSCAVVRIQDGHLRGREMRKGSTRIW